MNTSVNFVLEEYGVPKLYRKEVDPTRFSVDLDNIATQAETRSLYIYGPVGTGKTQLAVEVAKKLAERFPEQLTWPDEEGNQTTPNKSLVTFYNVPGLLLLIKDTFNPGTESTISFLRGLEKVEYLILDDLGVEKQSEWVQETLYVLLNSRYESGQKVIITSNKKISEIAASLGDRIASRLVEMCNLVPLTGKDKRLEK